MNNSGVSLSDSAAELDGRIPSLDGLRGVAVSLVMLAHATNLPGFVESTEAYIIRKVFSGSAGVQIFFVISGFIITHLFVKESLRNGSISMKRFYIRRILRLLPAAITFLGILFLLVNFSTFKVSNIEFISSLLFFRNYIEGGWFTGHIWSLSVEEQFYFLWPLIVSFLFRKAKSALVWALILVPLIRYAAFWHGLQGWPYWLISNMDCLAAGALLALCYPCCRVWEAKLQARSRLYLRFFAFSIFPLVAAFPGRFYSFIGPLQGTLVSIATAFLILSLTTTRSGWAFVFLNWPPIIRLGLISYSLYLWQQLFLAPSPVILMPMPLAILAAIIIGWCSWQLLERPFGQLRQKFH